VTLPEYPPTPPPPPEPRPIRGSKVGLGIGISIGLHVLVIGAGIGFSALAVQSSDQLATALGLMLLGELLVFLAVIIWGVLQIVRGDRGLGVGLLIGWAVGVIVLPVVGFGVCVATLSGGVSG
jgi:Ca2+/Na+ antiporter